MPSLRASRKRAAAPLSLPSFLDNASSSSIYRARASVQGQLYDARVERVSQGAHGGTTCARDSASTLNLLIALLRQPLLIFNPVLGSPAHRSEFPLDHGRLVAPIAAEHFKTRSRAFQDPILKATSLSSFSPSRSVRNVTPLPFETIE